jgi:hypothetical protein
MVSVGKAISLGELLGGLALEQQQEGADDADTYATIYASEPWSAESRAIVLENQTDTTEPPSEAKAIGCTYFLEVFIAEDFLRGFRETLGREPTAAEKCERLIYYATYDA